MAGEIRRHSVRRKADIGAGSRFWLVVGVLLGLLLLWDVVGPYGLWKLKRMRSQREDLYLANVELAKANTVLEGRIDLLKNDQRYQELEVRKGLGWLKDGEILYKFLGEEE